VKQKIDGGFAWGFWGFLFYCGFWFVFKIILFVLSGLPNERVVE